MKSFLRLVLFFEIDRERKRELLLSSQNLLIPSSPGLRVRPRWMAPFVIFLIKRPDPFAFLIKKEERFISTHSCSLTLRKLILESHLLSLVTVFDGGWTFPYVLSPSLTESVLSTGCLSIDMSSEPLIILHSVSRQMLRKIDLYAYLNSNWLCMCGKEKESREKEKKESCHYIRLRSMRTRHPLASVNYVWVCHQHASTDVNK